MTPKLAALSGFGNQARHRPARFLLAALARRKILTPAPAAEKSPKRRRPASPVRPGGVERGAREPRGRGRRGRAAPEAARGARRGSVSARAQPWPTRAVASASRSRSRSRASARGGAGPERAVQRHADRARTLAVRASLWRIPVSAGGRAAAGRLACWPLCSLSPDCAQPAAAPQAHRWLRGGRGCPRPREELANSLRFRARFPSPRFSQHSRPCFRRGVEGAQRGAPLPHPPTKDSGRCGPGACPSCRIPAPGSLMGRLSYSFIFLLTHQGKFGTVQGKVGARLGVHFASGGRFRGAKRWVCRSSRTRAGAESAPWELTRSLTVAPAQHWDNPRRAVSRLIVRVECRQMPASRESL